MFKLTLILGATLFMLLFLVSYCMLATHVFKIDSEKAGVILMTLYSVLIAYMFIDGYILK